MKQIDEWEADPSIFFRVTGKRRLHQEYSQVVAEEFQIREQLGEAVLERIKQDIKDGNLADDKVAELDRQLHEEEISDSDYQREYEELVMDTALEHFGEYRDDLLAGIENQTELPMDISEVFTEELGDILVYPGPNATERLIGVDQALYIASRSGWDWAFEMPNPVIHVIRGNRKGLTYDSDGIVIYPEETVAVFDWSDEFQDAVMQMEDDAFQEAALSPGD